MQKLISYIQDKYQGCIEVIVAKTDFGSWFSFAITRFEEQDTFILPQYGAGSSLYYDLAIYRSLTECIQMLDNYQDENRANDNDLLNFVELRPKFKPIAFLQLGSVFQIEYYDDKNNISLQSVEFQIQILVANMSSLGYCPSQYVVDYGDFFIVCSYTPNLERFYNIRKTVSALPLSFIQKQL